MSKLINFISNCQEQLISVVELDPGCGNAISKIWEGSILHGRGKCNPSFYGPPTLGFLYFVLFIINDSLAIINVPPYMYLPWPHDVLTLFVWGRRPFTMAVENVRPSFLVPPNFGF